MDGQHTLQPLGGRVLVVDDDPEIRALLSDFLAVQNFEVKTAFDAQTALALFQPGRFDALLVDFQMPGMTGLELAAAVRKQDPLIPIGLITGSSQMLATKEISQAGINRMFPKPFDLNEIGSWLASLSL